MLLDLKHFFFILLRGWKKGLNQVKRAASLLKNETCLCSIPASLETKEKGRFKRGEIKRLVVFAETMSSGFSDSLDCIYNIWPCTES